MLRDITMPSLHQIVENLRIQRDVYARYSAVSAARSRLCASPRCCCRCCCTTFDPFSTIVHSEKNQRDAESGGVPAASKLTVTRRLITKE